MKTRTKRIWLNIASSAMVIITAVLCFFAIITLSLNIVFIKTHVRGYSMQPTLNISATSQTEDGDTIYINKFKELSNNDIVVARVSWYPEAIIKRLVGKPGDIIEIKDQNNQYELYVNNSLIYTREKTDASSHGTVGGSNAYFTKYQTFLTCGLFDNNVYEKEDGTKCIKLNENEYFLMGDNWAESTDCIEHGPITKDKIVGKIDLVIPKNENNFLTFTKFIFTEILF